MTAQSKGAPKLIAITDRRSLDGDLLEFIELCLTAGLDAVQIREKDLEAKPLYELCRRARDLPNPRQAKLILNGRVDVALAAKLDGVHLPSDSLPIDEVRKVAGTEFVIGKSCHSLEDIHRAEAGGADYAYYSPIFESTSKPEYGPALGLAALERACREVEVPLYALGGVTEANAAGCLAAGAAGIASISLFQQAPDLGELAARLRGGS